MVIKIIYSDTSSHIIVYISVIIIVYIKSVITVYSGWREINIIILILLILNFFEFINLLHLSEIYAVFIILYISVHMYVRCKNSVAFHME
jgi:hypothetical protein